MPAPSPTASTCSPREPPSSTSGANRPAPVRRRCHPRRSSAGSSRSSRRWPATAGCPSTPATPRRPRAAVAAGATIINDVSASLHEVAAELGVGWVAMHMQGDPQTMQAEPSYTDVVAEVRDHLVARAEAAVAAGVDEVWIDPGFGFGKALHHNLAAAGPPGPAGGHRLPGGGRAVPQGLPGAAAGGQRRPGGRPRPPRPGRGGDLGRDHTGARATTASRARSAPRHGPPSKGCASSASTTSRPRCTRWSWSGTST